MKRFLASLLALAFLISRAAASDFLINPYVYATGGAPPAATISFVGCTASTVDGASFTFTDHATGTAGNRWTIVSVSAMDADPDYSISSMTVGGNAASEAVDTANASSIVQSAIYIISNPTGTTATIVVTPSEAITGLAVCVWAAYDLTSAVAVDTATNFSTNGSLISADLDVPVDGIAVGTTAAENGTGTITWTGMTERADATGEAGASGYNYSAADTTTPGTPLAVSVDLSTTRDVTVATASFR